MGIGPINPSSSWQFDGPPGRNFISRATDSMNQAITKKFGPGASIDNIGDYSSELAELIKQFYAAPNFNVASEIFKHIQLTLEGVDETSGVQKKTDPAAINEVIEQYIDQHGFSGSVMVVQNGHPIFSRGYGEARVGIPNGQDTTYRWDSVTKIITATAALQLSEKGLLNLYVPITTYLPEYSNSQKYPGFAGQPPVTLFSLLNMTSGIADLAGPQPSWQTPPTLKNIIDYVASQPRARVTSQIAGAGWHYSNTSYNLIAMIIGRVTNPSMDPGTAFGKYLQDNIFNRAGMTTASAPSTVAEDKPDAEGHIYDDDGNPIEYGTDQWPDYTSMRIGAGNVNGSIWDFEKFNQALNNGQLISMKAVALMQNAKLGGWDPGSHSINGIPFLAKDGAQDGEQTFFMQFPDNTMVFITANIDPKNPNIGQDHIQYLGAEIANLLFPQS